MLLQDRQAFGRYFGEEAQVLDAQGGAEFVQVCQSREKGIEHLAILRLTEKGHAALVYTVLSDADRDHHASDRKMSFCPA